MNLLKAEVDALIVAINGIIALVEKFDPNFKNNPFVIELQKILEMLQKLGL